MQSGKKRFIKKAILLQVIIVVIIMIFFAGSATSLFAEEDELSKNPGEKKSEVMMFGFIAAAVAFGFGAIGAGIAIANIGSAAMGAIAEKPEISGQALLFIALADTLLIFGFIMALMILAKV